MKRIVPLTLTLAALAICSCDRQGNRSGDTSRDPATGKPEPIDDGGTHAPSSNPAPTPAPTAPAGDGSATPAPPAGVGTKP